MPDPLPAPDLSGDVPRCVATCPLWSRTPSWRYGNCVDPAQGLHRVIGDLCTPYVRHLVRERKSLLERAEYSERERDIARGLARFAGQEPLETPPDDGDRWCEDSPPECGSCGRELVCPACEGPVR